MVQMLSCQVVMCSSVPGHASRKPYQASPREGTPWNLAANDYMHQQI